MSDITISIETRPTITDDKELQDAFERAVDESFLDCVDDAEYVGETPGVAPGHIELTLDRRDGGRLEGMLTEANFFLSGEQWVTHFNADEVPTKEEIEAAKEAGFPPGPMVAGCETHDDANIRVEEASEDAPPCVDSVAKCCVCGAVTDAL